MKLKCVVGHVLATLACCTCTLDSSCSCTCFLSSDAPEYRPHTLELRSSRENCDKMAEPRVNEMRWRPDHATIVNATNPRRTVPKIELLLPIRFNQDRTIQKYLGESTIKKFGHCKQLNGIGNFLKLGHCRFSDSKGAPQCPEEIFRVHIRILGNIDNTDILLVRIRIWLIRCQHLESRTKLSTDHYFDTHHFVIS